MKIVVRQQTQYGKTLYYPVNEAAQALARVARTETLTLAVLSEARLHFGAEIGVQKQPDPIEALCSQEAA
jgi:hypothetical protein